MEKKQNKSGNRKLWLNLLAIAAVVALVIVSLRTSGQVPEDYVPGMHGSIWALLPPIVAIVLALVTKEVYSSLFAGIVVGALLYAGGNGELALNTMLFHPDGGLIAAMTDSSHAGVLVVVILLASLVVMMNRAGGSVAFGRWAKAHIRTRMGAQLATIAMGILIFVDDGFNCMTVGSVMRPVTDSHNVSRAKLAYLIDSTAAPVCIIAPVSCWAAAVSYAVPSEYNINGFSMFLRAIPYNLYALGTLFMMVAITLFRIDYGPMRRHEDNALKGDLFTTGEVPYTEEKNTSDGKEKLSNLVIPVVTLIVCCIAGIAYTGGLFEGESLVNSFANADSARGLVMGGLIGLLLTFWLYMNRGVITFKSFMESFAAGFRSMCAPMIILILSWNLSGVTSLLGASDFIQRIVSSSAASVQMFVPMLVFVVSVFLAFSTGTSWGTFSILIPIVCAVFPTESEMLVISISACLAGAVCGDHCSPISDTTIMSSAGARCDHINHVSTQLPYALTVAAVCAVGYLIAGVIGFRTNSIIAVIATPLTLAILLAVIVLIRKRERA